ncbi:hypothetical protein C6H69_08805 [Photorhabdus luminescens]|nr:hypothetical protein C6H69_08805 [Photorhabdus luminescens]
MFSGHTRFLLVCVGLDKIVVIKTKENTITLFYLNKAILHICKLIVVKVKLVVKINSITKSICEKHANFLTPCNILYRGHPGDGIPEYLGKLHHVGAII